MAPDSALSKVLEETNEVFQFYMELNVSVYDPEEFAKLEDDISSSLIPYEILEKSYRQKICFVRDEFISIETMDEDGEVLHVYIEEIGGQRTSENISMERFFSESDILFPPVVFFTKHLSLLKRSIGQYDILPASLELADLDRSIFYKVGTAHSFLMVDSVSFKVTMIEYPVQIRGRYFPVKIEFSDWYPKKKAIPETVRFFINNRLFKETRLSKVYFSGIFTRRKAIVKKYKDYLPNRYPFDVSLDYGN